MNIPVDKQATSPGNDTKDDNVSAKDLFPKQVSGESEGNIGSAETTHTPTTE